jgi:hypothetical protein
VGSAASNVALVGNTFSFRKLFDPDLGDATPLVWLDAGASPTFVFNDLHRPMPYFAGEGEIAAAIMLEGAAGGVYVGNRLSWDELLAPPPGSLAFFGRQGGAGAFAPSVVAGNSIAMGERTHAFQDGASSLGWEAVEALALDQPASFAPNLVTADCTSSRTSDGLSFEPPSGACLGAAGDAGARVQALDEELPPTSRLGLRHDRLGRLRPLEGADTGSIQAK